MGRVGAPLSIRSRGVRSSGTEWVDSQQAGALLACRREASGQEGWTTARLVWLLVQEENPQCGREKTPSELLGPCQKGENWPQRAS